MTRTLEGLAHAQRGAAMVFGLFFSVFLVAMIYYLLGLSHAVMFRQSMQDASDAAAFSAAVVNARGMNLIALINMAMAAALSVLVGLRLAQTLTAAAMLILAGMTAMTGGSSLAAIGTLSEVLVNVTNAANRVEKVMPRVLSVLHTAGKVVSVVIPIGANVRVIDTVGREHPPADFGLGLPSRFTLPIEDDEFPVLCGHSGEFAVDVALLPLSGVLRGKARDAIDKAASAITAAGSKWFCGQGGQPPDLGNQGKTFKHYPVLPKREVCDRLTASALKHDKTSDETGLSDRAKRACTEAAIEELAATPNRNGQCREGQPVCPTTCDAKNHDARCPPIHFQPCEPAEAADLTQTARELYAKDTVVCGPLDDHGRPAWGNRSAYAQRLRDARRQCDPTRHDHYTGYAWNERTVTFTYKWSAARGWSRASDPEYGATELMVHDQDDDQKPCVDTPQNANGYERDERIVACQGAATCLEPTYAPHLGVTGPCEPSQNPRADGKPTVYREQVIQVTDIIHCVEEVEAAPTRVAALDLKKTLDSQKKGTSQNTSSFRVEKGVWLGGNDFQLRSVVFSTRVPDLATRVIRLASWGRADRSGPASFANTVSRALARFSLSQAEYYFDWSELGESAPKDQHKDSARSEFLWHMSWRARLRPFRLNHKKADGRRDDRETGPDQEQRAYLPTKYADEPNPLDCGNADDRGRCDEAKQILDVFGDGEEE